ncbi:MAG: Uma2 family endonuclease [Thermaceae bacterium]|nr:Uma2 family endonuclease [Thermaceae bacterium]
MPRPLPPIKTEVSLEQFLEFEFSSREKHEFVDGQIFLMAGGTRRHNRIAVRLGTQLEAASEGTSCLVAIADTLVWANGETYYPDVMIYCENEDDSRMVKWPCVVVEVLLKGTADIDRGEKWLNYQTLESLQAYVLLEQETSRAEIYRRTGDGWHCERLEAGGILRLPCVGLEVALDVIYSRLN